MKILHIDSSILGDNSASRVLTAEIVAALRQANSGAAVDYLDLAADPVEHFSTDALGVKTGQTEGATPEQARQNELSERLVSQFLAADVLVVGAPQYNFDIPTQLKAWIDRLAQPGRTFRYTAEGPVGLAGGKTLIVASTRGGKYPDEAAAGQLIPRERDYLRLVFGFMGITDVRFVRADGLAMGDEARAAGLAQARREIDAAIGLPLAEAA
ncbi:FMN-dependent NADH-azoreductase [Verticiella sediminum]|uniref:FMN dependent NADH:quinone oxidoreductase n=1 Tax=Verticiella sediminum TaxID=1247510 RepID=A0A556AB25_9BURK|nr:FMN-dependent NADH-azoreductase [Verticiella sediminum]TSH90078.1 FMN-dependent NADH-azoreductase [Verticiella sediminum]